MTVKLTRLQNNLLKEIDYIAQAALMDHWNIRDKKPEWRTSGLKRIRDQLVRSEINKSYVYMDELLTAIICKAYFKQPGKRFSYDRMWKTKKQRAFVHHVTDGLYLLQKTRLVNDLKPIPKEVRDCIERLNSIRNAVAHSLFPASRYQYRKEKNVLYRGADIFTQKGFDHFDNDVRTIENCLYPRAFSPDPVAHAMRADKARAKRQAIKESALS